MSDEPDPPKRPRRSSAVTLMIVGAMIVVTAQLAWIVLVIELSCDTPVWFSDLAATAMEYVRLVYYGPHAAVLALLGLSLVLRHRQR